MNSFTNTSNKSINKISFFNNIYEELKMNPDIDNKIKSDLNKVGIDIINDQTISTIEKQETIAKLLVYFPQEGVLYHIMGMIIKETSLNIAMNWFKLCYEKAPNMKENVLELSIIYSTFKMVRPFIELDKNGLFDKMINDPDVSIHFLNIYVNMFMVVNNYKNVTKCLTKLINKNASKKCVTKDDKHMKWWNYHHLGFANIVTSNIVDAIKYTGKASELADKFDLSMECKLLSFQNYVAFNDFIYNNINENFDKYLKINDYLPNNYDMFSFENRFDNNDYSSNKKIRIGYVSSDFVNHSVANFINPILKNHSRNRFEVFVFINMDSVKKEYIDFLKQYNIQYHIIFGVSDKKVAEIIYNENIDILFDLNGHTVNNRLGIFSLNPAPIQVTYLGYPNTTGLKTISYRITDGIADSPYTKQLYTEELIRLSKCFLLFHPAHQTCPTTPRKTDPNRIILGSLNKEKKTNLEVLETWKQILHDCPNTVMLIKLETFDNNIERTQFYINHLGVDKSRLIVLDKLINSEYDTLFTRIDILLDVFPYSGTTTTCDALYNSIPVVTMTHPDYHCHNVSASILTNCGLNELVTTNKTDYINKIKDLIMNTEILNNYKRTIHSKFMKCMDPSVFIPEYEEKIEMIYSKYYGQEQQQQQHQDQDKTVYIDI